jgi:hypothetical protein
VLNLYISPEQGQMACRLCMGIYYPSSKVSWRKREPKRLRAWLGWFQRQVNKGSKKKGSERAGSSPDTGT